MSQELSSILFNQDIEKNSKKHETSLENNDKDKHNLSSHVNVVMSLRQFIEDNRSPWFGCQVNKLQTKQMKNGKKPLKKLTDVNINYDGDDSGVEWYSDDNMKIEEEKNAEDIDLLDENGQEMDIDNVEVEDDKTEMQDGWVVSPDDPEFGDREFQEHMRRSQVGDVKNTNEYPFKTDRQRGDEIDEPIVVVFIPLLYDITNDMRNNDARMEKYNDLLKTKAYFHFEKDVVPHNPEEDNIITVMEEKDEKSAITEFVSKKLTDTQKFLQQDDPEKTLLLDYIQSAVNERTAKSRAEAPQQLSYSQLDDSAGNGSANKEDAKEPKAKPRRKAKGDDEEPEQPSEEEKEEDGDVEEEKPKTSKKKDDA